MPSEPRQGRQQHCRRVLSQEHNHRRTTIAATPVHDLDFRGQVPPRRLAPGAMSERRRRALSLLLGLRGGPAAYGLRRLMTSRRHLDGARRQPADSPKKLSPAIDFAYAA